VRFAVFISNSHIFKWHKRSCWFEDINFKQTIGVRQGGSLSCPLFTFYIDETINSINRAPADDWLQNCHCLLLMDNTALLATSRRSMLNKLQLLKSATDDLVMTMHPSKSRFLVINTADDEPFTVDEVSITRAEEYIYLGTPITNENTALQVKRHIKMKTGHVFKFSSFVTKNRNLITIYYQKQSSRKCSSLLYGCETWLCNDLKPVDIVFNNTLKLALGVRTTTSNQLACVESNSGSAKANTVLAFNMEYFKILLYSFICIL
jgi:hypothetical protein